MVKKIGWLVVGAIAAAYLLNLTFGVVELVPDNVPLFGNLDEAIATALLLKALAKYGVKLNVEG